MISSQNQGVFCDIAIVGGGMAGLLGASVMASYGLKCALVNDLPTPENRLSVDDGRTTAIMNPNIPLFEETGLWKSLADFAAPLKTIRIVTGTSRLRLHDFHADELSQDAFAFNIPNNLLKHALWLHCQSQENIQILAPETITSFEHSSNHVVLHTDKNRSINTSLIIAADGRNSMLRNQLGIGIKHFPYEQKALVCSVYHEQPHEYISIERHKPHGPFTSVPLPDPHRSSIVWCDKNNIIDQIARLPEKLFIEEMQKAGAGQLGRLSKPTDHALYPLSSFYAQRLTGTRTALIGEAAHAVHPLGAQGFNLTMQDISVLAQHVHQYKKLGLDIGSKTLLSHYENQRQATVKGRVRLMNSLTRISSATGKGTQSLWGHSVALASHIPPLRRWAMRYGMVTDVQMAPNKRKSL